MDCPLCGHSMSLHHDFNCPPGARLAATRDTFIGGAPEELARQEQAAKSLHASCEIRIAALEAQLLKHGSHINGCPAPSSNEDCTCGWSAIYAGLHR